MAKTRRGRVLTAAATAAALFLSGAALADNDDDDDDDDRGGRNIGNVIFLHPDGTALNHWHAGRMYWEGPDGILQWDKLREMAIYRGHMSDNLTGTSNGGATAHAFGVKVQGPGSYGTDRGLPIFALSGYPGSILREAANKGYPTGLVNDGDVNGEPGTGAFAVETISRGDNTEAALQLLGGRPGFDNGTDDIRDGEPDPVVVLGGGERFFLPEGIPQCTTAPSLADPQLDCFVHQRPEDFGGLPNRSDGRNLLEEAVADGWIVIRTRAEFDELFARIHNASRRSPYFAPKVLGLFAADDIFNDEEEEKLATDGATPTAGGLVRDPGDPLPPEGEEFGAEKIGPLVLWGAKLNDPNNPFSFNPPTVAEMGEMAIKILDRRSRYVERKPFFLVAEVESTDNFPNQNNGIGALRGLKRSDDLIGVARAFEQHRWPFGQDRYSRRKRFDTLVITAADSDGSGMQVMGLQAGDNNDFFNPLDCGITIDANSDPGSIPLPALCTVSVTGLNSTGLSGGTQVIEIDGIAGRLSPPFVAEPDAQLDFRPFPRGNAYGDDFGGISEPGRPLVFGIAWNAIPDMAGGVVTRAQGMNARLLSSRRPFRRGEPPFYQRFDNTDIYRMAYLTLFGKRLPSSVGMERELDPDPDRLPPPLN